MTEYLLSADVPQLNLDQMSLLGNNGLPCLTCSICLLDILSFPAAA